MALNTGPFKIHNAYLDPAIFSTWKTFRTIKRLLLWCTCCMLFLIQQYTALRGSIQQAAEYIGDNSQT